MSMSFKIIFSALLMQAAVLGAVESTAFRFSAKVQGDFVPNEPAWFSLPREVISETCDHFVDLRLFDDLGRETPYVIYEQNEPEPVPPLYRFKVVSYKQLSGSEEIVLEKPKEAESIDQLRFSTLARDFKKSIQVYVAADMKNWRELVADTLFDFSSRVELRKTSVEFSPTPVRYFKVVLRDQMSSQGGKPDFKLRYDDLEFNVKGGGKTPVKIDEVMGRGAARKKPIRVYESAVFMKPAVTKDKSGNSIVDLGRFNLPLAKVSFRIANPYYYRKVEVDAADTDKKDAFHLATDGIIYNFPAMKQPQTAFSCALPQQKYLQLKVINGNNPPLEIQEIKAEWFQQNLYFMPEKGRRYTLFFGSNGLTHPDYELSNFISSDPGKRDSFKRLTLGSVQKNPNYNPQVPLALKEQRERWIFRALVVLIVIGVGVWAFSLMKKMGSAGKRE